MKRKLEQPIKNNHMLNKEFLAFVDTMEENTAILNKEGKIVYINQAWIEFGLANDIAREDYGLGVNYLEIARNAEGEDAARAEKAVEGIKAVLAGEMDNFTLEYPCHSPEEKRWFRMKVKAYGDKSIVMHENITKRVKQRIKRRERTKELEGLYYTFKLAENRDRTIDEILSRLSRKLADFWQHPEKIQVRIRYADEEYLSENFRETGCILKGDIVVLDEKKGTIEVFCPEEKKDYSADFFLAREEELLQGISRTLSGEFSRRITENKLRNNKNLLQSLTNKTPGTVYQYQLFPDGSSRFPYATEGIYEIYEVTPEEIKEDAGKVFDRLHSEDYERVADSIKKSAENLTVWEDEYRVNLPEKGIRWVEGYAEPEKRPDGSVIWYGNIRDVTERKKREEAIKNLHDVAVNFKEAEDEKEVSEMTVEAAENLLNFQNCKILLVEEGMFKPTACTSRAETKKMPVSEGIAGQTYRSGESFISGNISSNPEASPVKDSYKSLISIPVGNYGVFQVLAEEEKAFSKKDLELAKLLISHTTAALERFSYEKELEYMSFHDELTGLYNRRFLQTEMKRLNTERQLPLSIVMLDINDLKIINDSMGHDKGDELIVKTAELLKDNIRKEDILARYGGDEFVILLPQTSKEKAEEVLKRIRTSSEKTEEEDLPVSLGAGIAVKNNVEREIYEILKKADDALNRNKLSDKKSRKNKLVQVLLNALAAKSDETRDHALRMTDLASRLGVKLGITNSELNRLSLLASLHDIGKTSISEEILTKPGELTDEEWEIMKEHPERGYKIASASAEFAPVAEDILAHHERWDGEGYPQGLKGESIPYLARIISIIDAYDVMTSNRSYSPSMSKEETLREIKDCAGGQFDPELAEKFVELMKEK
ncbi:diguanylate cyclase [Halarsenatibacter silvermanii]|nr:diguanylate cyclase [Halarsenatibacter silvermanii]